MNHADFNTLLRKNYREKTTVFRNVGLPSDGDLRVSGDIDCATFFLSVAAVQANMQDDKAAFEAWAIVLMVWCGVKRIAIDWCVPDNLANGHYQRFLYRLDYFEALLGPALVDVVGRHRLAQCRITNGSVPTFNVAGLKDSGAIPSLSGSEADLEKRLATDSANERNYMMNDLDLVKLDRQMPVGVFDGEPALGGGIFTGGKSAIDLVGLDASGALWLFELKTASNIKVGALSEMFFYSMVMRDARNRRIAFSKKAAGQRSNIKPKDILAAPRLHVRLLAEAYHPLLTEAVFATLTNAAMRRGWPVDYGFCDLGPYLRSPPLQTPAGVTS